MSFLSGRQCHMASKDKNHLGILFLAVPFPCQSKIRWGWGCHRPMQVKRASSATFHFNGNNEGSNFLVPLRFQWQVFMVQCSKVATLFCSEIAIERRLICSENIIFHRWRAPSRMGRLRVFRASQVLLIC